MANASLRPLYERLNGVLSYRPLSANTFTDWSMEAGDVVTVIRGDEEYDVPVHNSSLVWKGKQQISIESTGAKKRDPIARSSAKKYGRGGAAVRNSEYIFKEMYSEDGYLHSYVLMTASVLRTEFTASISGTSEYLYSFIEQTASSIRADVGNTASGLYSEIVQTAEEIMSSVYASNSEIYSTIDQTASGIRTEVGNAVSGLHTEIVQTSESIMSSVTASNSQIYSTIEQTASSIRTDVGNAVSGLHSEIVQTSESIMSSVSASNSQIYSTIEQTASSISSTVSSVTSDLQSQITQTANTVGMVVSGTGSNAQIKPAAIQASINSATGTSKIVLSADNIVLDGDAVASALYGKSVTADFLGAETFQIIGDLYVDQDVSIHGGYGDSFDMGNIIVRAVNNTQTNTLTLTTLNGDVINFSKATTLSGTWSGANNRFPLSVDASPQGNHYTIGFESGNDKYLTIQGNGSATRNETYSTFLDIPVRIVENTGSAPYVVERYSTTVMASAANLVQEKSVTLSESATITPDPEYFGLSRVNVTVSGVSSDAKADFDEENGTFYIVATEGTGGAIISGSGKDYRFGVSGSSVVIGRMVGDTFTRYSNTPTVSLSLDTGTLNTTTGSRTVTVKVDNAATTVTTNITDYLTGRNATKVSNPTWQTSPSSSITGNSNLATFTTDAPSPVSGASNSLRLYMTQGTWGSNNKKYVYINQTDSTDANRVARLEVDASTLVTNAGYAGRAAVNLANPSWTNAPSSSITGNSNTVTVSTTGRTNSSGTAANVSKSVVLYLTQGSWDNSNKKYVYINQTDSTDANRVARIQVDASTLVSNATTNGKNAVTLNDPTWTSAATHTGSYNTITVTTNGRPTQLSKSVTLYLTQDGWSGGNKLVDMRTNSTTGAVYAETTVSMPNPVSFDTTHADTSVTVSGHTNNASGYYITTAGASGVAGIVSEGSWWAGDKKFTQYSYFEYAPTQLYRKAYGDGNTAGNRAGRAAVTLSDPSADARTTLNESRTWTVSTVGRQNSSGIAENLSKTVPLHLYANGWSDNTNTVYLKWGSTAGSSGTNYAKIVVDATERYNAGYDANHSLYIRNSSSERPVTGTVTLNPGADVDLYAAFNKTGGGQQHQQTALKVQAAALGDPTNFGTTSPNGESLDISGVGTITNNSDGYYLAASGSSGDAYIIVKANWTQNGQSKTATNYLHAAPTKIYQKGYSDGVASAPSYTRYTFSKTRTQASDGYHYKFEISTGWSSTFGGDGGTYYLYKKN